MNRPRPTVYDRRGGEMQTDTTLLMAGLALVIVPLALIAWASR